MVHDAVLDDAVRRATAAVQTVAESPRNDMSGAAVAGAQPQLAAAITTAIAPVIQHATNTEAHWWQKRSRVSMVVSFGLVILAPALRSFGLGDIDPATQAWIVDAVTMCGNLAAGFLALRAGQALTPMFTPKEPANPVAYRG